ncbi:MAG: hypothetical protein V4611_03315 [Patescibacteria group bacterium]
MSAEFSRHQPEQVSSDEFAIAYFNEIRSQHESLIDFLQSIQAGYEQDSDGRLQILQMLRAARFINQENSGSYTDRVQAVFNGQLLASQLLNYIYPDLAPVSGLANSFLKSELEQSRIDGEEDKGTIAETHGEQVARVRDLAADIIEELLLADSEPELSDAYEIFGELSVDELYSDQQLASLALVGYRLILREYEKSVHPVHGFVDNPSPTQPSPMQYTPSNEVLKAITQISSEEEDTEETSPFEDISYIRRIFLSKYNSLQQGFKDLISEDGASYFDLVRYSQLNLSRFNISNELLRTDDDLGVRGNFFGFAINGENYTIIRFNKNVQIRGQFNGLTVVNTPEPSQLSRSSSDFQDDQDLMPTIDSPALQIANPTMVTYNEVTKQIDTTILDVQTLDIPFIYKKVILSRLKSTDPNNISI